MLIVVFSVCSFFGCLFLGRVRVVRFLVLVEV